MVDDRAIEIQLQKQIETQAQTIANIRFTLARTERERDDAAAAENAAKREVQVLTDMNARLWMAVNSFAFCATDNCDHTLTTECAEALVKSMAEVAALK